jgi:hypothetical protein
MSSQDVLEMIRGSFHEATRQHGIDIEPLMTQPLEAELFRVLHNLQRDGRIPEGLSFRLEFDSLGDGHIMPANSQTWNYVLGVA